MKRQGSRQTKPRIVVKWTVFSHSPNGGRLGVYLVEGKYAHIYAYWTQEQAISYAPKLAGTIKFLKDNRIRRRKWPKIWLDSVDGIHVVKSTASPIQVTIKPQHIEQLLTELLNAISTCPCHPSYP